MDGQDYLNQISASNRPLEPSKLGKILSSKLFLLVVGSVFLFIIILIIGSILSSGKKNLKDLSYSLKLHLDNTSEIIKTYQNDVKSSSLRSSSASLSGILADTNNKLTKYITNLYNYNPSSVDTSIINQTIIEKDNLAAELSEAKINGILDRIYAHKMAYEISTITAEETKIINTTKDESLIDILTTSYNSLLNLYDSFNNFSETN